MEIEVLFPGTKLISRSGMTMGAWVTFSTSPPPPLPPPPKKIRTNQAYSQTQGQVMANEQFSSPVLHIFYKQHFFQTQPQWCLTFQWIKHQMLIRCCLIHVNIRTLSFPIGWLKLSLALLLNQLKLTWGDEHWW